jgi:uncharacterized protein YjeT (DUF2065 family)
VGIMKVIVFLLGIGYIAIGSVLILYTRSTVDALKGLFLKYPLKYVAVFYAIFGFLFLISASAITYPWIFRIIGLAAIIEAVLAYTNPQAIFTRMLDWYFGLSDQAQRLVGIVSIILGTAFIGWII